MYTKAQKRLVLDMCRVVTRVWHGKNSEDLIDEHLRTPYPASANDITPFDEELFYVIRAIERTNHKEKQR